MNSSKRFILGFFLVALTSPLSAACPIKADERIEFFPTLGSRDVLPNSWQAEVHGWIYEPETDSQKRQLLLAALRQSLEIPADEPNRALFERRAKAFLVDNEEGKAIRVKVGEFEYALKESNDAGHIYQSLSLGYLPVDSWTTVQVLECSGERIGRGRIWLAGEQGVAVISDIDDTIKISDVGDRQSLLRRTFLLPFESVSGMSEVYQKWSKNYPSMFFYYLSASPWQLHAELTAFLKAKGFPEGILKLRQFRWKDQSFFNLFQDPERYKTPILDALFQRFPYRRFILVGDSGEKDPEIYGEIARRYPAQIEKIYIRLTNSLSSESRWKSAFKDVPPERWKLFQNAQELLRE